MENKTNSKVWIVGIGVVVMAIFAIAPFSGLSLFLRPLSTSLNVSVGEVSLMYSFSAIGGLITALSIGKLLKKFNPKIIVFIGGITLALFFLSIAFSKRLYIIYIASFLHGFGGITAGFTMAQITLSQWFYKARGTMLSVCSIGLSLSLTIVIPIIGTSMEKYGYQTVAFWEGIISGAGVILVAIFCISGPPERYGLKPYGYTGETAGMSSDKQSNPQLSLPFSEIVKIPAFWSIVLCMLIASMASQGFNSQGASFFKSIGLDAVQSSYALSVFSFATMGWSLLYGVLSDKVNPTVATIVNVSVAALALLLSYMWTGWTGAIISAVCFAAGGSVSGLLGPTMVSKLFGTKEAGSMVGFTRAGSSIGAMLGPVITGFMFDKSGSYALCLTVMGVCMILVLLLAVWSTSNKTINNIQKRREEYGSSI